MVRLYDNKMFLVNCSLSIIYWPIDHSWTKFRISIIWILNFKAVLLKPKANLLKFSQITAIFLNIGRYAQAKFNKNGLLFSKKSKPERLFFQNAPMCIGIITWPQMIQFWDVDLLAINQKFPVNLPPKLK